MSEKNLSPEAVEKLKSDLQAQTEKVDNLEKEKAELQEKFDTLSKEHEESGSLVASLKEELEKNVSDLNSALEANKLLVKTMEDIAATPATAPAAAADKKVADFSKLSFEKDGVKYGFHFAKITHRKMAISADEIAVDEKLQDELIALKSGILKVL